MPIVDQSSILGTIQEEQTQIKIEEFEEVNKDQQHGGRLAGLSVSIAEASQVSKCQGILLESMTGPSCQIDEIDDFTETNVGLLKDAICHCLGLAEWVQRQHI